MRKKIIWLLIVLLLLPYSLFESGVKNFGVYAASSQQGEAMMEIFTDRWKVIPEWTSAPSIDGRLDESVWDTSALLTDFRTSYFNESIEYSPVYRIAYDQTNLYIAGSFTTEEKEVLERIEIVISPQAAGELHYVAALPVTRSGRNITADWNPGDLAAKENPQRVNISTYTHAFAEEDGQFTVEMAIPLSTFGTATTVTGSEWRMNITHLHHLNTLPLTSWIPIRTAVFNDTGGTVTFRANYVDEGRLGSIYFNKVPEGEPRTPEETELIYTGYTSKRLSFKRKDLNPVHTEYELYWKDPVGDWQQIQDVQFKKAGKRNELTFNHPAPIHDGLYQLRLLAKREGAGGDRFAMLSFDRDQMIRAGIEAASVTPDVGTETPVVPAPPSQRIQDLLELIPDRIGFIFTGLPEMPELHPYQLYQLTPDAQSMVALKTNTVYPNSQYPEDKVLTVVNSLGQTLEYPYYEDEEGKQYFLSAHLWYLQKDYTLRETNNIATADPLGAARLLHRFAQVYEGYVPTTDYIWYNHPLADGSGPPFNYWGGMWYRWSAGELSNLRPILQAYAKVKQTNAFAVLSQEVGEDVEKRLVEKLIIPSLDYVLSFPKMLSNMNYTQWLGLIDAGKVMKEPDYIHAAVEWMIRYVETQYLSDGFWKEVTPSYHVQSTNGMISAMTQMEGYSDPVGYISPRSGAHYDNVDMRSDFPIISKAAEIQNILVYPDGRTLPVQDSWANERSRTPQIDIGSMLLPASGIARLAQGKGVDQMQVYLGFVPKYGHNHFDPLNLNLFAQGQEMLPDLGYTYTKYRYFTTSTLGHNTVVVDSKNMENNNVSKHGGNIELFAPAGPVQTMRASWDNAYSATSQYSREPWLISFPGEIGGEGYVLDLFRVSGGSRHEYTLHGDANHDAIFETDLSLQPYGPYLLPPGTVVREAENFNESGTAQGHYPAYIYVNDVQKAQLDSDRYELNLVTTDGGTEMANMKITGLLETGNNELYLGRSPSIRPTRLSGRSMDTNDEAVQYDMPKMVLRREGPNLQSTFITTMEPYLDGTGPRIEEVSRLQPTQAPEGAVAVKVTYGDVTDIMLSNPRHPEQPLMVEDITLLGEVGFIRMVDGVVNSMYLVGGTSLQKGSLEVTDVGPLAGTITGTMRKAAGDPFDAVITDTMLPADLAATLPGKYVVLTHPDQTTRGYEIGDIRIEQGRTIMILAEHDPGFEIYADGSSEMRFYPAKQWDGSHTFRIANSAVYERNPLQHVSLQAANRHLLKGESATLEVSGVARDGSPVNVSGANVTYTSSHPEVLTVDTHGVVRAVGEGTSLITAEVWLNGVTQSASIFMSAQHMAQQSYNFIDLPIINQTTPIRYFDASNTVQFEADEAGHQITFEFEVNEPELYEIAIIPFKAASYGKYLVSIDGNLLTSYDFFGSGGARTEFETIGTVPLTAGQHQLTLQNDGKDPQSTNYKFGLLQLQVRKPTTHAPVLQGSHDPLFSGEQLDLFFADSASWRQAITGIEINGVPLRVDQYQIEPGRIRIDASAFDENHYNGAHWIVITAPGYRHATVEQQVVSWASLSHLAVSDGILSPSFESQQHDYAVVVGPDIEALTIIAEAYRADSTITVTGATYGNTVPATVQLQPGPNPVNVLVESAGADTSIYRITVYRDLREVPEPPGTGTVSGQVFNDENVPLVGATVRLVGHPEKIVETDATGMFVFDNVPVGRTQISASRLDYDDGSSELFEVVKNETSHMTLILQRSLLPKLIQVTEGAAAMGDPVWATSSRDGTLHLVPEATPATKEAIEAASQVTVGSAVYDTRAYAAAGVVTMIDTTFFNAGIYRVYAMDEEGLVSTGSSPIAIIPRDQAVIDDTNPLVQYSGVWGPYRDDRLYGGSEQIGREKGATVTIPFYGNRAQILGTMASNGGFGDIYVDGQFVKTFDFLLRGTAQYQHVFFDTGHLPLGAHTVTIVSRGEKQDNSLNIWIRFDAALVTGYEGE